MNIFEKRPLGLILGIVLGGLYIFSLLSSSLIAALSILAVICSVAVLFITKIKSRRKICALLLLFIFSGSLFRLYLGLTLDSRTESGTVYHMSAFVTDMEKDGERLSLTSRLSTLDGDDASMLIFMSVDFPCEVDVGDEIIVTGQLTRLYDGEITDGNRYLLSKGISAICYPDEIRSASHGDYTLEYRMKLWRIKIAEYMSDISGEDAGGFFSALLLGDTRFMSGSTSAAFSRLGITHILALSGTHITLLSLALSRIMGTLGFSKRTERIALIITTVAFMILVGFPSSVLRAGIMVIISTLLVMLSGSSDSITSLFVALALILLIEPHAVLDLGLTLSFLATLAILVYADYLRQERERDTSYLTKIKLLLMFSVFAISATQIISALYFDKISAISAISTLIFGLLTEFLLYLGIITLILGGILPIGALLRYLCAFTENLSVGMSRLPYLEYSSALPAVIFFSTALFIIFCIFTVGKIKNRRRFVAVLCTVYILSVIICTLSGINTLYDERAVYQCGKNDRLIAVGDGESTLIDFGKHSARDYYGAISIVYDEGLAAVDNYFFIGYDAGSDEYLDEIFSRIYVKRLFIPHGTYGEDEARRIRALCDKYSVELCDVFAREELKLSSFSVIFHELPSLGAARKLCSVTLGRGGKLFSYMSPDSATLSPASEIIINEANTVAFGFFGSEFYPYTPEVLSGDDKRVIISSPYRVSDVLISKSSEIIYEGTVRVFD